MVARTQALAAERGVALQTATRTWAELDGERFDAVLCVGNSLTHAGGRAGRRTALDGMRRVSRDGALLVDHLAQLGAAAGRRRRDRRARRPPRRGAARLARRRAARLQIFVTLDDGSTYGEELSYWPFTHDELDEDLRAAGFEPEASTWTADAERYAVTSRAKVSNASR